MLASTTTALLTLLTLASASPVPSSTSTSTSTTQTPFPNYSITDYTTGCSPAGCTYSFSVSYQPDPAGSSSSCSAQICEPSFSTSCNGTDIQGSMAVCDNALITSNEIPGTSNVTLQIQHTWDQDVTTGNGGVDGRFWALANYTVVNGVGVGGDKAKFDAPVVQIGGIA
jgi:hypothetical protein